MAPDKATNVVYSWLADGVAIDGATAATYTIKDSDLGKKISVRVDGDDNSTATSAETEPVKAAEGTELAITAEQNGSSSFKLTANQEIGVEDTIKIVRGTSVAQTIGTIIWNDTRTEATITLGSKIGDAEYTVTLTPADASKKAASTTFTGKTAALKSIDFKGTNLVLTNSQMTTAKVLIFGYNDFDEEISLSDISVYPTKGTAAYTAKDNTITVTGPTMGNDSNGDPIYQPFTVGETVNINVVYQDNGVVLQKNASLTVASQAAVAEITFGELQTTDTTLKDAPVNMTNMATGTYYKVVTAKDQYETTLTKDDLNGMIWSSKNTSGTLYVNPTSAAGQYVYFTGFDTLADKKTVIAKFKLGDIGIPGKGIISFNSVGGANVSTEIDVVDDPYIDALAVTASADIYAGTEVELSVEARDQDNNILNLYDFVPSSSAWASTYVFTKGGNSTNKQFAQIAAGSGQVKVTKDSAKRTVIFKYKYTATGTETFPVTDILTVKSAHVTVNPVSLKVQKAGEIAGIQGLTSDATLVFAPGDPISLNLEQKLVFKDNYGGTVANGSGAAANGAKYPVIITKTNGAADVKAKKASATAGANTLYGYTVYNTTGSDWVDTSATLTAAAKYKVELWKVSGTSQANVTSVTAINSDTGATVASLGTYEFEIKQSSGSYKDGSFKASVKAGEELLYAGSADGSTQNADYASVVVTAYDNSLKQNVTVPATACTITVSDTRASVINDNQVQMNTKREPGDKTTEVETGKLTAEVWYNSMSVASVDIDYSDADPEAKAWSWKVLDKASVVTSDAPDEITVTSGNEFDIASALTFTGATATLTNATAAANQLFGYIDSDGSQTKQYTISALNQYGLKEALVFSINGTTIDYNDAVQASNYRLVNGTFRVQSGKLIKDIMITGNAGASVGAITVSGTIDSRTIAGTFASATKSAGTMYIDNDGTYDTTNSKACTGTIAAGATSFTVTAPDAELTAGGTTYLIFKPADADYQDVATSGALTVGTAVPTTLVRATGTTDAFEFENTAEANAKVTISTATITVNNGSADVAVYKAKDQFGKDLTSTACLTIAGPADQGGSASSTEGDYASAEVLKRNGTTATTWTFSLYTKAKASSGTKATGALTSFTIKIAAG